MTDGPLRPVPGPPPGGRPGPSSDGRADATPPLAGGPLDAALAGLDGLEELTTADHVGVLEAVHDALVAELARTED